MPKVFQTYKSATAEMLAKVYDKLRQTALYYAADLRQKAFL